MTATATPARGEAAKPRAGGKLYCRLDDWEFDPRYTGGACPICGWRPDGAVAAVSRVPGQLLRIPWDYIILAGLAIVLLGLGVLVGMAAHVNLLPG